MSASPKEKMRVVEMANKKSDWETIDWVHSQAEAQEKAAHQRSSSHGGKTLGAQTMEALSHNESFLAALISGVILGILGVLADASSHFVSAFRNGICVNYFWLSKSLCCIDDEKCDLYYTWGEFFAGKGNRVVGFTDFIFYVGISTAFAATSAFFCKCYAPYAAGGGINEVKTIVSGHHVERYLGGWTLITKTVGMCLSTGSGIVVGKEGPFVHIGACVGDLVSKLFPSYRLEAKKRELISAGAAGGLAVAFGAPIGGVIFALEEISTFYNFKALMASLICGIAAVLVQSKVDLWHTGHIVQFSVNYQHDWHFFELPVFAIIGAFSGLAGSFFNEINIRVIRWRKQNFKNWRVTEVAVLAVVTAVFNFFTPYARGSLLDFLGDLFQDCTPTSTLDICKDDDLTTMVYLLMCGVVKLSLFIYSVGTFLPAGVLVPSLAIGAIFGRAFGIFFRALQVNYSDSYLFAECFNQQFCIIPGAYAIVGAAGMLTGVTRMSICLAIIMFELTGSLEYLVPVTIGILCAKAAGEAIGIEGIYEIGIEENKLPFLDPKKEFYHHAAAEDIYKGKKFMVLTAKNCTIGGINDLLSHSVVTGFPVVTSMEEMTLLGYATVRNIGSSIQEALICNSHISNSTLVRFTTPTAQDPLRDNEIDLTKSVESSMIQVEPTCPVSRLLYLFKSLGTRHIMVSKYSHFEGFISKKDFIMFMRKIEHEELLEEAELMAHLKENHAKSPRRQH